MATFLVASYEYRTGSELDAGPDSFSDDNGTTHEPSINKAALAGFTGGAAGGGYAPVLPVKRDQMASFIARELDLLVEEQHAVTPA